MKKYYTYTSKPTRPTIKSENKLSDSDFVYSHDLNNKNGRPELLTIIDSAIKERFTYNADVQGDIGIEALHELRPLTLQMQTTTTDESITLPMTGSVSADIDWGDGTTETVTTDSPSHTFASAGTYDIKITGSCDSFNFYSDSPDGTKLLHVLNGGTAFTAGSWFRAFRNCTNLATADFAGLDTSSVTTMQAMFRNCEGIRSLDVTGFDTSSVTNMADMFYDCRLLTSLDVTGFDTSSVTDMNYMFGSCQKLTSLDVTGFDTSNVTSMRTMFYWCFDLTSLDVTGFDTSSVTNIAYMFFGCNSLTSLDLTGFDTSSVTDMSNMFNGCFDLTSLDVTGFDTSSTTNMLAMFRDCNSLTSLDVTGFDTSSVTDMSNMFRSCSSLTSDPGIHAFDVTALTDAADMCIGANAMLSETEYNTILVNWEAQTVNDNVDVHFGDAVHSGTGTTARTALINDHTWTITDGGAA